MVPLAFATAVSFSLLLAGTIRRWHWGWTRWNICLLLCMAGMLRYGTTARLLPAHHLVHLIALQEEVEIAGEVAREPEWVRDDLNVVLDLNQVVLEGAPVAVCGAVLIRFRGISPGIDYGDSMQLRVRLRRPEPSRNPGTFDYRSYLARMGIYGTAKVRRAEQIVHIRSGKGSRFWKQVILPIRKSVRRSVERNLSGAPAGLLKGLLLGEKRSVPEEVRETFTRSGVNHVLAVSGLHVGLVAASFFFGLRCLGLGRRGTGVMTVIGIVMYALVTGLRPSVLRASIMGSLVLLGSLSDRDGDGDGLNAVGVAGLGLLAFRPRALFDVGFQLSFSATVSILALYPPIRTWLPAGKQVWQKWVFVPVAVSLAAQAGTAPFVATYFGQLSPVSLVGNLVIVPLVGAAVSLGLLSAMLSVFFEQGALLLNGAIWAVLKGVIACAGLLGTPSWALLEVPKPSWAFLGLYLSVLLAILPEARRPKMGRWVAVCALGSANLWVWGDLLQRPSGLEMTILDVGQGDAIFLRSPGGRTILVDGGVRRKGIDMGERVLVPFLRERRIRRIDVVVASHPHADHIGGLVTLLETFEVGAYLDAGQQNDSWTALRIKSLIRERDISYYAVAAGDSLVGLGGIGGLVLHPNRRFVSEEGVSLDGPNNGSVVLRLTHASRAVLLTGDIERETDSDLLLWGDRLRSEVLKVAHHGSRTSSTARFLEAVQPRIAVISCGVDNRFGHPALEVIDRFEAMGIPIYRTDRIGAIRVDIGKAAVGAEGWLTRP